MIKNPGRDTETEKAALFLKKSQFFRDIVNSIQDSIIIADGKGRIIFWSRGARDIFGYDEKEVKGKTLTYLIPKQYKDMYQYSVEGLLLNTQHLNFRKSLELYGLKKDGSLFPVELSASVWEYVHLTFYTIIIRDISERKQMEDQLQAMSLYDELTGLYNRRGFFMLAQQQLKIADRMNKGLYLIFADLDGLKKINDDFGHQEGSMALVDIANILTNTYRESDIIARIGGDEFVIMAMETADSNPEVLCDRLEEDIALHNKISMRKYVLSISVGIARYDASYPSSLEELLSKADHMMYEHKKRKRLR